MSGWFCGEYRPSPHTLNPDVVKIVEEQTSVVAAVVCEPAVAGGEKDPGTDVAGVKNED